MHGDPRGVTRSVEEAVSAVSGKIPRPDCLRALGKFYLRKGCCDRTMLGKNLADYIAGIDRNGLPCKSDERADR